MKVSLLLLSAVLAFVFGCASTDTKVSDSTVDAVISEKDIILSAETGEIKGSKEDSNPKKDICKDCGFPKGSLRQRMIVAEEEDYDSIMALRAKKDIVLSAKTGEVEGTERHPDEKTVLCLDCGFPEGSLRQRMIIADDTLDEDTKKLLRSKKQLIISWKTGEIKGSKKDLEKQNKKPIICGDCGFPEGSLRQRMIIAEEFQYDEELLRKLRSNQDLLICGLRKKSEETGAVKSQNAVREGSVEKSLRPVKVIPEEKTKSRITPRGKMINLLKRSRPNLIKTYRRERETIVRKNLLKIYGTDLKKEKQK